MSASLQSKIFFLIALREAILSVMEWTFLIDDVLICSKFAQVIID